MNASEPNTPADGATDNSLASIDVHLANPWPEANQELLHDVRQGFVVASPPFAYVPGNGERFWNPPNEATDVTTSAIALKLGFEPKYGVITTQTCDIVDHTGKRPWVQVAPVFLLENPDAKTIEKGWNKAFWHVPGVPAEGYWVADLRIEIPVEKDWLAARVGELADGFPTPDVRRNFANALARKVARPAIPDDVVKHLAQPLVDGIKALKKSEKELFNNVLGYVDHFCLYLEPDDVAPTKVTLVAITEGPREGDETWPPVGASEWLLKFAGDAQDTDLPFEFIGIDFEQRDEITYADHAEMVLVDIHRLSPFEGLEHVA